MRLKKEWVTPILVGAGSFSIGIGLGFILGQRRKWVELDTIEVEEDPEDHNFQLQFEFDERTKVFNRMIQEASSVVERFNDDGKSFLDRIAEEMHASMAAHPAFKDRDINEADYEATKTKVVIPDTIFKDIGDENWDYEAELEGRGPEFPYIIHRDEFFNKEMDCTQTTLTYYKGDDILCDEHDVPIYNYGLIVGELKFGHGSEDSSIVYVRNENLGAEYEVILDHGYFQVQVLGTQLEDDLDKDVKHSVRKFKRD
jgi:hypothetical protein